MRLLSLLLVSALGSTALCACGAAIDDSGTERPSSSTPSGSSADPPNTVDPPVVTEPATTPKPVTADCPDPANVIVANGETLARPSGGGALRLLLVYQGASLGIQNARGVDMVVAQADGPFADNAGYWIETGTATSTLYTRLLLDPTVQEASGGPGGAFSNSTVARCQAKSIRADVPNDPAATEIRVFGSPYGTQERAVLLARYALQ